MSDCSVFFFGLYVNLDLSTSETDLDKTLQMCRKFGQIENIYIIEINQLCDDVNMTSFLLF